MKRNLSLLYYNLGLLILGSVAWMPLGQNLEKYYSRASAAWDWLLVFLGLTATTFVVATMIAGILASFLMRDMSFDQRFYRIFFTASLILTPILTALMIGLGYVYGYLG